LNKIQNLQKNNRSKKKLLPPVPVFNSASKNLMLKVIKMMKPDHMNEIHRHLAASINPQIMHHFFELIQERSINVTIAYNSKQERGTL
jgi:hypothetical protein